jgi:tripartite-type tricarboxylate transporter receptor subunit TctC
VLKVLQRREVLEWLATQVMDPLGGSPEDMEARVRTAIDDLQKVIRDADIRLN